jgi:hypothetical protein
VRLFSSRFTSSLAEEEAADFDGSGVDGCPVLSGGYPEHHLISCARSQFGLRKSPVFDGNGFIMRMTCGRVAAAALGLVAAACEREAADTPQQDAVSYAPYEPGSPVIASNPSSFRLISAGGPARFATFQQLITHSGNTCDRVTSAVLKGGMEKADEWRVNCASSGNWSIWLNDAREPEVKHCSTAECR